MLLDLGRAVSLVFSILSLYGLMDSAFFIPDTRWEQRLIGSVVRVGLAACACFLSGLLFSYSTEPEVPLTRTLPMRMFFWTLFGVVLLFALSWFLDVYYMPLFWRNQPH